MRNTSLSRRQRECLEARLRHMTAKDIGRELNISHHTVAMHWRLARLKLGASTTLSAALHLAQQSVRATMRYFPPAVRQPFIMGWVEFIAALTLMFAALLSAIWLLTLLSWLAIQHLELSTSKPNYGFFD